MVGEIRKNFSGASETNREQRARSLVESLALALQASLVIRHTPPPIAAAFLESRLGAQRGHVYGTLPAGSPFDDIIALAQAR